MGGAEEINADGSGSETVVSRMESTVKLIKMSANSETITSSKTAIETLVSSSDSSTESSGSITSTVLTSQITLLKEAADASFEVKTLIKFSLLIIEMINKVAILTTEEKTSMTTLVTEKISVVLESIKTKITEEETTLKAIVEMVSSSAISSATNMETTIVFQAFSTEFSSDVTKQVEFTETIIKSSINLASIKFLVTSSGKLASSAVDISSVSSVSLKTTITSEFMVVCYGDLVTLLKADSTSVVVMQISLLLLKMAGGTISKFSTESETSLTTVTTEIKTEQTSLETQISEAETSLSALTGQTESGSTFGIAEVKEDGSGNEKVTKIALIVVRIVIFEVNLKITDVLTTSISFLKSSESSTGDITCADYSTQIKDILDKLEAANDDDSVVNLATALFKETKVMSCSSAEKTTLETYEATITTISAAITTEITTLTVSFKTETTLEAVTTKWNLISLIGISSLVSTTDDTDSTDDTGVTGGTGATGTDDTDGTGGTDDTGGTDGTGGTDDTGGTDGTDGTDSGGTDSGGTDSGGTGTDDTDGTGTDGTGTDGTGTDGTGTGGTGTDGNGGSDGTG